MARAKFTRLSRVLKFARLKLVMIVAGVVLWPMRLAASRSHAPQDVVNAVRLGSLIAALGAGRDPRALSAATARALEPASSPLAFSARIFARRRGSPWALPDAPVRRAAGNRSNDAGASGLLEEGEVVEGDYGRLWVWLRRAGNDTNGTEGSGTGAGNGTNTGTEGSGTGAGNVTNTGTEGGGTGAGNETNTGTEDSGTGTSNETNTGS